MTCMHKGKGNYCTAQFKECDQPIKEEIKTPLTYEEKLELYRQDLYAFPPPPVCTAQWTQGDWIRFIDHSGIWLQSSEEPS